MVKPRIPEGGAIVDDDQTSAEEYSAIMKKVLKKEYLELVQKVTNELCPPEGSRVLEIGPGPGWIGIWLARARPDLQVTGLEPSADMRRVAAQNAIDEGVADSVHYIDGFVENMEIFPDESFDVVISNGSLHHWENPKKGFQEIARVGKSTGKIFIQDNRRDYGLGGKIILHVFGPVMAGKMYKGWTNSLNASYTPEEVRQFLAEINVNWTITTDVMELAIQN
jgi:ubiquinone/menaquinone biosynthesis C-methylase UbiE